MAAPALLIEDPDLPFCDRAEIEVSHPFQKPPARPFGQGSSTGDHYACWPRAAFADQMQGNDVGKGVTCLSRLWAPQWKPNPGA